jgi:hypothetical protein
MYQANKMNYLWLGAHTLFMGKRGHPSFLRILLDVYTDAFTLSTYSAGITYLYSLWNVALGNIDDPPSIQESIADIQSCSSVLQALSCSSLPRFLSRE